jgi:uncharacterized membrane protein
MKIILAILCSQVLSAAESTDQPAALSGAGATLSLTRLLEQFDANSDGKLSAEERAAFAPLMTAAFDLYVQQPKDDASSGIRPAAARILAQTDKLVPIFDKNNNGILDEKEKEQAAFSAAVVQRWCPDFDNNSNGRIDNDEQTRLTKAWNDYLDMLTRNAPVAEEVKGSHQITGGETANGGHATSTGSKTDKPVAGTAGTGAAAGIQAGTGNGQAGRTGGNKPAAGGQGAGGGKPMAGGQGAGGGKPMAGGQGAGGGKPMAGGQGAGGGRPGPMGNNGATHNGGNKANPIARDAQKAAQKQNQVYKTQEMRQADQKLRDTIQQDKANRKKKVNPLAQPVQQAQPVPQGE